MPTNPYADKNGGPKLGQMAEFFQWEQQKEAKRREKLTPEQRQKEDENRRAVQRRWDAESEFML
ncbi:hypothetical protein ACO2Q8_04105 [Larkinella sp. VNQ87]|uniref:hypothetical protein n=1 Tax=Larkinella sp. VNQ87 TaxID=3400921 RepID=UPI003C0A36E0